MEMLEYKRGRHARIASKMKERRVRRRNQFIRANLKDITYLLAILFISAGFLKAMNNIIVVKQVKGETYTSAPKSSNYNTPPIDDKALADDRVTKLKMFLEEKNSPLSSFAKLIVSEADKYDIGWTKIVAISGIESRYGNEVPKGSYNAWGLGGSDFMYFSSWSESIKYVSKLLGTHYKQNEISAIKYNYCPSSDNCNPAWTSVVLAASNAILNK